MIRPIAHSAPALAGILTVSAASAVAQSGPIDPPETAVQGERLDPALYGPGVVESWDVAIQRDLNRPGDWVANPRGRNGAQGVWVVPSRGATDHPHSGRHYVTNKWGDTSMGIGFPQPVEVQGAFIAGQSGNGAWTTGLRAIGYRNGIEVGVTNWFEDIDDEPSWFAIDMVGVDRIVFESRPVIDGGGWYALDDFTYVRRDDAGERKTIVLDFEDCQFRQKLTGSSYAGLTWETGTGDFEAAEAVHPPQVPPDLKEEKPEIIEGPGDGGRGVGTLPDLQTNFQGVIRGDLGSFTYPPDTCGAVGPDYFVVIVNRVIAVFDKVTGERLAQSTLGSFLPGSSGDPRILYDQYSGRWIVLITDFDTEFFLAVSSTSNPLDSWFKTSFVVSTGPDAGRWPDYPTLGVNEDGIYAAAYMVGTGARMSIFAIDKAPLIANQQSLGTVTAFRNLPWEGAMQPVHTYGSAPGQYFLSRGGVNSLRVRLLTGELTSPELSTAQTVYVESHGAPPDVPALGSNTPLDSVGPRPMNAVYRDGSIYTAHTIDVNGRAGCRWYEIDAATCDVLQWGTVADEVFNYFFPSITVNAQGDAVMGFSGAHAGVYAGAYYTGRRFNDPWGQMADPALFREGDGPQNNIDGYGRNRWGDYSLTSLDPDDELTMWTIQEYAHSNNTWGTEIAALLVPSGPPNDHCGSWVTALEGETLFSTIGATTDGPDEPADCDFNGYSHLESDIWFKFAPLVDGEATISLCGSSFDTKLALYIDCPSGPGEVLACNDDSCGQQSELTYTVTSQTGYRIRIGGVNGEQGEGVMNITIVPAGNPCPADVNGDGTVDVIDLLALLAAWGNPGGPEDVNADGIVDVLDLLELLSAWGPCP